MLDPIFKEITAPLARELAEYALLRLDLKSALNGLTLWFEKYGGAKT